MKDYIAWQIFQIRRDGYSVLPRKIKLALVVILKSPLYVIALPLVLVFRIIRPWLLMRFGALMSLNIGHFALTTELYLCEHDAGVNRPVQRHIDLFYFGGRQMCNQQLATMWKRTVRIWPAWILDPVHRLNRLIPGGEAHEIGNNTQNDRDVHNLLDRFPSHLQFNVEECMRGDAGLSAMGIPIGTPFICLTVRDSAYMIAYLKRGDYSFHNYRDSDVQNYWLAAQALADRGYYVIRMGVKVHAAINSDHPKIIDYATNGMRNDFMDIYLAAKCSFCISSGTGFDSVPQIFRRPIAFINHVPIVDLSTFQKYTVCITKHHLSAIDDRELSLKEIIKSGAGFCRTVSDYESRQVKVIENTPEEIRDVAVEMSERLNGTWQSHAEDETLQQRFWELFPTDAQERYLGFPLHGEIRGRFGAAFLRNNRWWLQ